MGGICPCPRRRQNKEYPYDVHEETFEIEENTGNLGQSSPKNSIEQKNNNILTQDLRTSQQGIDRSPSQEESVPIQQVNNSNSFQREQFVKKDQSNEELIQTNLPMKVQQQKELLVKEQPQKKVEQVPKFQANILKQKITKKKYNPDDYRFKDQNDAFKVKKIDSIKEQQYNIDNCKGCTYFVFDITANVYIDDCEDCFLFIAPCQSTIFVRNCKRMTIAAVTGQFRTYQCHSCTFSLYCKSQPVIQSSSDITFTSFNSPLYYKQLPEQMKKKKFVPWNNHWSQIHNFTKKEGEKHYQLVQNVDLSFINWQKAFQEAELPISQIQNPVVPIKGDLPYEPQKVILIMLKPDIQINDVLNVLKGSIILKGNHGVMQGQGKNIKTALMIDCLNFMPQKYEQIGTVIENSEQIKEKQDRWFISFGDSRQK